MIGLLHQRPRLPSVASTFLLSLLSLRIGIGFLIERRRLRGISRRRSRSPEFFQLRFERGDFGFQMRDNLLLPDNQREEFFTR